MEIYDSEEQQEEAIKRFLKENGTALVIGALLGLGGIYGYNQYQQSQIDSMATNSAAFSQLVKTDDIVVAGEKYVASHGDSQYSQLTQLLMVKALVEKKEFDKAVIVLKQVIGSDVEDAVKSIAKTRLARIELSLEQFDSALSTLNTLNDDAFAVQKNELSGDVYIAQGMLDKARTSYETAVSAAGEQVGNDLQMKLNDLAPAS